MMVKKDLEWFSGQSFKNADEFSDFMRREYQNLGLAVYSAFLYLESSDDCIDVELNRTIQTNAEIAAWQITLIVAEYIRRNSTCNVIQLDFSQEGVPSFFELPDHQSKMLWFRNGYQPDWFDDIPLKLDVELESAYVEAVSLKVQDNYQEALLSKIECHISQIQDVQVMMPKSRVIQLLVIRESKKPVIRK